MYDDSDVSLGINKYGCGWEDLLISVHMWRIHLYWLPCEKSGRAQTAHKRGPWKIQRMVNTCQNGY